MAKQLVRRQLTAIFAADVVGYSRLVEIDEVGTLNRVKTVQREIVGPYCRLHAGRIVKTTGDGILAEFASAVDAVACAVDVQAALRARNRPVPEQHRIVLRIGINLDDVIHDHGDVFGGGVNVAARLEGLAEPGGICVTRTVFEQARDRVEAEYRHGGQHTVKNITHAVDIYHLHPRPDRVPSPLEPSRRGIRAAGAIAAGVLAVAIGGWIWLDAGRGTAPSATPAAAPAVATAPPQIAEAPRLSIAVMPFANLGGDAAQDALADGITEDLITDLTRISGAFVIARNSSFAYKGRAVDRRRVAAELGVRHILEGSVRRNEDSVRINAQLIEAETGSHVWADRFDVQRADIYKLQDEVTGRIARALNVELKEAVSRRVARGRPENLDAADLATVAWSVLFNKPQTAETNEEARPLLQRAIALDPRNAEAWTGLSYMHTRAARYGWAADQDATYRQAVEAGERAVAIDPDSADAQYVLGFAVYRDDLVRARRLFERCLDLNPNYAPAYFFLGLIETYDGNAARTPDLIAKAFRLSPRDGLAAVWHFAAAQAHVILGNNVEAIQAAQAGIAINPQYPLNYRTLAAAKASLGQIEDARRALERYTQMLPEKSIADVLARGGFDKAHPERYRRLLDGLRKAGLPD